MQGMVEGSLGESLSKGTGGSNDDTVKKLSALLLAVDRLSTVETLYCTARMTAVQATWDELAASAPPQLRGGGSDVLAWLPRFLTWLASFLEQEAAWCVWAYLTPKTSRHATPLFLRQTPSVPLHMCVFIISAPVA